MVLLLKVLTITDPNGVPNLTGIAGDPLAGGILVTAPFFNFAFAPPGALFLVNPFTKSVNNLFPFDFTSVEVDNKGNAYLGLAFFECAGLDRNFNVIFESGPGLVPGVEGCVLGTGTLKDKIFLIEDGDIWEENLTGAPDLTEIASGGSGLGPLTATDLRNGSLLFQESPAGGAGNVLRLSGGGLAAPGDN
jgi:hypothetical protein